MIKTLIPCSDIPATQFAGRKKSNWLYPGEEQLYERNPHPNLSVGDVTYSFNSYGYRCPEFSDKSDINVVSVGCSWTFGTGLPYEYTFPELFCRKLSNYSGKTVTNWNISLSGGTNDYISRTLLCSVPILKPDIALICFTAPSRRDYISADGTYYNLNNQFYNLKQCSKKQREILIHYLGLVSHHEDQLNFHKNYKLVELLLNQHNVSWLYTSINGGSIIAEDMKDLMHTLDARRFLEFGPTILDLARDNSHPGIKSMTVFAERLFQRFISMYNGSG